MSREDTHISDQDLIRSLDGELTGREASRVQGHLEACWTCRARQSELNRTIENFVAASHRLESPPESRLPEIDGPRALLRARLREIAAAETPEVRQRLRRFLPDLPGPLHAGLAVASVLLLGIVLYFGIRQSSAASVPDSSLTPGATRTARRDEVCAEQLSEGFYPIPATLAYRVFEKYRIRNPRPRSYEVDYLITPALGGADDIRNLWPQPYAAGEWNAHVKDALEDHLHRMVCAGSLDLETAQRDIAANWITAYRKYFKTDRPLPVHELFSIDPPWEE